MKAESIIKSIRDSFVFSVDVYTKGSCYKFFEILKAIFPDAVAWYSLDTDHVLTCIDGVLYDINGVVIGGTDYKPLSEYSQSIIDEIKMAKFNGHLDYIECPNCSDLIKIRK